MVPSVKSERPLLLGRIIYLSKPCLVSAHTRSTADFPRLSHTVKTGKLLRSCDRHATEFRPLKIARVSSLRSTDLIAAEPCIANVPNRLNPPSPYFTSRRDISPTVRNVSSRGVVRFLVDIYNGGIESVMVTHTVNRRINASE